MNNYWGYFIFVGCFILLLFVLKYYYTKKIRKKRKKSKNKASISYYKCLDGHKVRSKGELIIDNYLYVLGVKHIYEKQIKIKKDRIKSDFYLKDYDVYIEYWGFHGKRYLKRKKEKIRLYKKAKLKLISVENYMFSDIYSNLNKLLKSNLNMESKFYPNTRKKHCYNCGAVLDERF